MNLFLFILFLIQIQYLLTFSKSTHVPSVCYTRQDCQNYNCKNPNAVTPSDIIAWFGNPDDPGHLAWQKTFSQIKDIMNRYPGVHGTLDTAETHTTLKYFCCYTELELQQISAAIHSFKWTPFSLNFTHVSCNGFVKNNTRVDFFALLDDKSNTYIQNWIADLEKHITAVTGIPIHKPRLLQTPFHATIGSVELDVFPVEEALTAIAKEIPILTKDPIWVTWFLGDFPPDTYIAHS